jgi:hypothetical protein
MTQMTQSMDFSSAGARLHLGHSFLKHGLFMTQMTQACKFCITTNNLQLGVDNAKKSFTIATLATKSR